MLALLLFLNLAWSQEPAKYTVQGVVKERGTRKILSEVNIFLLPLKLKSTTDKNGKFEFRDVPEGQVQLVVNLTGYNKFQSTFDLNTNENDLEVYVEKQSYKVFETTVSDLRSKKDDSQKTLKQSEFLQMPGSGGDPVKAVQNLPGVNRATGGNAKVIIQGSEPEDTKYNIEGHDVPLIFHFGGLSSIVTPEAVDSIDYLSAGYGSQFGRAMGGHVGLNVRYPKTDRTHGLAFMDIYNAGGLVEGPIDEKSSYLISGRYSYIGYVLKAAAKNNKDFNLTVAPVFYDFNAQYHRKLNAQEEVRVFSILSHDEFKFVLNKPVGNDPKLRGNFVNTTDFYRIIPQWNKQIDESRKVSASLGYGANNIFVDVGSNYFHLQSTNLTARAEFEQKLSQVWKYQAGIDNAYSWYDVNVKIPATFSDGGVSNPFSTGDLRATSVKGKSHLIGMYIKNEVKFSENSDWTLLPALRGDYIVKTKETVGQPRLGVRYAWDKSLTIKASTGLYHQEPSAQQADSTYGNPDIKSQRAIHYTMGFEKDFRDGSTDGATFSSTAFYKKLDRLIVNSSQYVTRDGVLTSENYNNKGTGFVQGLETQLKLKQDLWSLTGSYTYSQSRRQQPGYSEMPSPYDQTHSLNLLYSYEEGPWTYGARFRYVSGNPYTPVVSATYDSDNDVYIPQRGDLYSARNKDFFQLDFRIDRKWVYDTWIFSGYLDIQNVTNQKNQEGLTYSYNYSEKQEITGLPMIPSIGIKGEF